MTMALASLLLADLPAVGYLAIFSQDPTQVSDPLTVEIVGPGYHRPRLDWTNSGTDKVTTGYAIFAGIPAGTLVQAMGVMDDYANGDLLVAQRFITPYHFRKGGYLSIQNLVLTVPF